MSQPGETLDIRAAVTRSPGAPFVIEPVRLRAPRGDEVRVRIVATGLCHTDLIVRDQHYPVPLPAVLGHEGAGVVESIGPDVRHVAPGDHVVLTFGHCGQCRHCRDEAPTYCDDFFGRNFGGAGPTGAHVLTDADGKALNDHFFTQSSLATHAMSRENSVVPVRRDAPLALLGPLGCGIQTGAGAVMNTLQVATGSDIAIFGAGSVGLSAVLAARAAGAARIIVVDRLASRLALAAELGATDIVDAGENDALDVIARLTGENGVRFAVESTGNTTVLRQSIAVLGKRGTVAVVGAPALGAESQFDVNDLLIGGKQIRGVVEGDSVPGRFIPALVDLYLAGRFPFDRLVRYYDFADINQVVADSEQGITLKPILTMDSAGP
ncbi:NAD(P)-dependent alcohol dehydrogenase [Salinisphaera sp. Q1T1-3]|uniref:NAD(P)-dependent alcohol dehydrogenase n=1 Tax=Salinisphaera sp. Q1T1-3 TaxID=2321229 RepID=UPI000E76BA0D|nr:NAD(P)-dependent alcohol dehydrogenase [Salinisphaera sp. Q1T1-3]RJS91091.1 NAD(P)-dependent alcohol dehydrogenase [Salinisphaera sp. Q1T1-3]